MTRPNEKETLEKVPEDDGKRGELLFALLGPGSMELVRRFGEEGADQLLTEWAEMFVGSFMVAMVAAGIVEVKE